MYACVYVCICAYVSVLYVYEISVGEGCLLFVACHYLYVYVYAYMLSYVCALRLCMYIVCMLYVYMCMHACTYAYTCIYRDVNTAYTCIYRHVKYRSHYSPPDTSIHTHTNIHTRKSIRLHIALDTGGLSVHACIRQHTQTHTHTHTDWIRGAVQKSLPGGVPFFRDAALRQV